MEQYAQPDTELRRSYGFGGLVFGTEPTGDKSRSDTSGGYTKPMEEWTPTFLPQPAQYENRVRIRVGSIYVTTNENSSEKRFLANLSDLTPTHIVALRTQPKQTTTCLFSGWSPRASRDELNVLYDLIDNGRHDVAQRLNDLIEMYDSDPDVGSLNLASFRSVAEFFKQNGNLEPAIVAGWDGVLSVEWRLPPVDPHSEDQTCGGILSLEFLPNGQIEYLGFIKSDSSGQRFNFSDTVGLDDIIDEIYFFLQRM